MDHTGAARATKYIFVSGGVVSSVGKGITVASIGRLLKARGISVCILKLDPYINVDPGTMSPYQHGEVFVTDDGAETDLDLGHYERFIDENLSRLSNVTTGQIYSAVIGRERRGDFLGGTIQVVPHITNEIKERIERVARQTNAQVVIAEVGGTVGDIECQPFLEALRQIHRELERDRTLFVHLTLLPYVGATGELKTKPTQHSVKELRSIGIQPDVICARSDYPVPDDIRDKIALFCDVDRRAVVPLETADTIYSVPLVLEAAGLGDYIVERLGLDSGVADLDGWRELVHRSRTVKDEVVIGVVGKYVELQDAYISVREAIFHAAWAHNRKPIIKLIDAQLVEQADDDGDRLLEGLHGIVVPGGFGYRGVEGKIRAARFAREHKVPYLGLCLGMQVLCIEFARHVLGSTEPNSTEFNLFTRYPVIDLLPEQRDIEEKGATMRLGVYPCQLRAGTRACEAYDEPIVFERHRHRYEFNNTFRDVLANARLVFSGTSPDGRLVEIAELQDHPFMLGSQFHPELKSRPNRPHPLFRDFVAAAAELAGEQLALLNYDPAVAAADEYLGVRILVTGGAGFIGSHVADGFRAAGHEVAVVDDLSTGNQANLDPSIKLYKNDIRDESLDNVFKDFRPEIVDHHAAQANVPASLVDPVHDASVNVLGGLNLLRLAALHGVRKFIYISSGGAMYGEPDPQDLPVRETAPVRPLSPYGASKQALEAWLGVYQRTFGLDYTVLRYGNIYGPRQGVREEGAVVAVFATRMAADQPLTIDGTGQQTRDFVYVGDCVAANVAALERGSSSSVNIGTGRETSVREIFDSMAEVAGYTRQPEFGPGRQGDVMRIVLDPTLAREKLGWQAKMPLHEGLARTYKYFNDAAR